MSVELDPVELGFRRPFTHEVSQTLRLQNPNSTAVAFKVKTTAPKQYCVRPNSGRIEPGRDVEVQVLLQAMREDPPLDARCKDKFLVQSVPIDPDREYGNVAAIWSSMEQTNKSLIQEKKIRVNFLPADGHAATPSHGVNGISGHDASFVSATPEAVTPQRGQNTPAAAATKIDAKPEGAKSSGDAVNSAFNPATDNQNVLSAAAASVSQAVPTSMDELKAQLAEARATIGRLSQQADQGLRQRKVDASSRDSGNSASSGATAMGVQHAPSSGVPVQVVAGLCLLSFLMAYFFF